MKTLLEVRRGLVGFSLSLALAIAVLPSTKEGSQTKIDGVPGSCTINCNPLICTCD